MIPRVQFTVGVRDDQVKVHFVEREGGPRIERIITSVRDFARFIVDKAKAAKCQPDDLIILYSSSMDFPEDSTRNKVTIKLARALR